MSATTTDKIRLMCVRQGGKLRIRFHSYTNHEGKTFGGVYNNSYNCQFPKDIRAEGAFYEIPQDALVLVAGNGKTPFYRVKAAAIRIVGADEAAEEVEEEGEADVEQEDDVSTASTANKKKSSKAGAKPKKAKAVKAKVKAPKKTKALSLPAQIFEVTECVICMEGRPGEIFIPCAHLCCCTGCWEGLKNSKPDCPLCRRHIANTIKHTGEME